MIRMAKQTRLKPEEIIVRAVEFFGEKGEQLKERERNQCCVYFEGVGGYVMISIAEENKKRTLDIETREFEYQVKRFLKTIGFVTSWSQNALYQMCERKNLRFPISPVI